VYLHTGVVNYATVTYTSNLLVYGTHMYFDMKQFPMYVRLSDAD